MLLDRVTITGADDGVRPEDLAALSKEFPFVEWGLLASHSRRDTPRYPSFDWMGRMDEVAATEELAGNRMKFSLHVCGAWVRSIMLGHVDPVVLKLAKGCDRVQLNLGAEKGECKPEAMVHGLLMLGTRQIIIQIGTFGRQLFEAMDKIEVRINAVPLFDASGGTGVAPEVWPAPFQGVNVYHGYAGGLNPENLANELRRIALAAGDTRVWIDMESGVRSADGLVFDLDKARRCLETALPFIHTKG